MNILDSLFSGGILGGVLNLGTRWFEVYAKKKESEIEIAKMTAMASIKAEESSWSAFAESQKGVNDDVVVSDKASTWVVNIGELVDCFRGLTRPALTWILLILLFVIYLKATPADQALLGDKIVTGAFTALFWWFGSRYSKGGK